MSRRAPRDSLRQRVFTAVVGWLGAWLLRLLGATWRIRSVGTDPLGEPGPFVAALWHRGFLIAVYRWRGRGVAGPVSLSRDGDLLDRALRQLGYPESPRGSSSRGGSGLLRGMLRSLRAGTPVAMLPDGPRGPARRAKPGPIALARAGECPVVPVGISASPCLRFGSWDRALLPLPFARVVCAYGPPLHVPKRLSEAELENLCGALERSLDQLTRTLDAELGLADEPEAPEPARESSTG